MRFQAGSLAALCMRLALGGAVVSTLVLSTSAQAQTAADKGTARKLALEGIDLFKAGKFADALDKLQRAQDLYDAPVHLVYIARCQAKLGLFVEAAESYRRLVRIELPGGAPQAFKDAVEDAKKELPSVEPKIAQLKIEVEPKSVKGIKVVVDDAAVSAAALGVDRPTNPGSRKVTASAPGYKEATVTVDLKPGESKSVALTLEVDPDATKPEGGGEGTGGQGGTTGAGEGAKAGGPTEPETPKGPIGFIVGLRIGGMLGAGDLAKDQPMKDYFPSAGSGEVRAGIRFMQNYSLLLFGSAASFQPGSRFEKGPPGSTIQVTPVGSSAGVGFMYAPKPGKLGPFGELDFMFVHRLEAKRDVDIGNLCTQTLSATGNGFRLGGGVHIPVSSWFQLSPYTTLTFGTASEFNLDSDCAVVSGTDYDAVAGTPWADPGDAGDRKATHLLIGLGIGGDFLVGGDI